MNTVVTPQASKYWPFKKIEFDYTDIVAVHVKQRAYIFYFSQAKQSKTREARIEKYIPHILMEKGLNDR